MDLEADIRIRTCSRVTTTVRVRGLEARGRRIMLRFLLLAGRGMAVGMGVGMGMGMGVGVGGRMLGGLGCLMVIKSLMRRDCDGAWIGL